MLAFGLDPKFCPWQHRFRRERPNLSPPPCNYRGARRIDGGRQPNRPLSADAALAIDGLSPKARPRNVTTGPDHLWRSTGFLPPHMSRIQMEGCREELHRLDLSH